MTINDMSVLLAAIELAVKRGAFSVLEIGQVGAVAEKLNAFIGSAKEQMQATQEAQGEQNIQPVAEQPAEQGA
jgi:hypothetical protein